MAKAKRLVLHVVPTDRGWKVESGKTIYGSFYRDLGFTKRTAVSFARGFCLGHQPSQLVIHKRDGRIQEERTYGDDPRRSKG